MYTEQSLLAQYPQEQEEQSLHLMQWKLPIFTGEQGDASDLLLCLVREMACYLAAPSVQLGVDTYGLDPKKKNSILISKHCQQQDTSKPSFFKCFLKVFTILILKSPSRLHMLAFIIHS